MAPSADSHLRPMKRLVTQFDEKRTRATVATPTCCCCCCCVASIVTATAVTVLNANDLAARAGVPESRRWLYWIEALLALPLAVLAGIAVGFLFSVGDGSGDGALVAGLIATAVAWPALLLGMYQQLGLVRSGGVVAVTVIVSAGLFVVEFIVGALLIVGGGPEGLYLSVLLVPFLVVPLLRRVMPVGGGPRRH